MEAVGEARDEEESSGQGGARGCVAGEGREGAIIQRGIHLLVSSVLRLLARPPGEWASHMDVHPQHVRITETSKKVFLWTSVLGFCNFMATLPEGRGATQHRLALRSAACVCLLLAAY